MSLQNTYSKTLGDLLAGFGLPAVWASVNISHLTLDSRTVQPGSLFFAVNGEKTKGENFVRDAMASGASAIVIESEDKAIEFKRLRKEFPDTPILSDIHLPKKISGIASQFYNHPSSNISCVGITGTNGKSSCVYLVSELWRLLGRRSASIGTLGYGLHSEANKSVPDGDELNKPFTRAQNTLKATGMTTPDAISTQQILAEMRDQKVTHLAMEVSSHGIDQGRTSGVRFNVRGLTNVTRDHLDYHKSFAEYARVKSSFIQLSGDTVSVVNIDDGVGLAAVSKLTNNANVVRYSLSNQRADIYASERDLSSNGITARIVSPWGSGILRTHLLGDFNLSNLLACISICCACGENFQKVLKYIDLLQPAPGRMQQVILEYKKEKSENSSKKNISDEVSDSRNFSGNVSVFNLAEIKSDIRTRVYVDFAHTPDALEKAIAALRQHTDKKLWVVFGCGGDRDVGKRSLMGEIAAQLCDYVIITSDNPRSEKPEKIIKQISAGAKAIIDSDKYSLLTSLGAQSDQKVTAKPNTNRLVEITDRELAIAYAINHSLDGDTVLIAGKGHEEFQIVGNKKYPFSDYKVASKFLHKSIGRSFANWSGGENGSS